MTKKQGRSGGDLIALEGEIYDPKDDLMIFDPIATWKRTYLDGGTYTVRQLPCPCFLQRPVCLHPRHRLWRSGNIAKRSWTHYGTNPAVWPILRRFTWIFPGLYGSLRTISWIISTVSGIKSNHHTDLYEYRTNAGTSSPKLRHLLLYICCYQNKHIIYLISREISLNTGLPAFRVSSNSTDSVVVKRMPSL